ncbi:unnamed protein product [Macrosiphum euphorbiae]|uniref:Uncharacterized protein n=1 Tax=Macrosiphum euphorbiae TaxID=13131 RepID=A0AAV0WAP1_9HEMI|nr:unnamed protein product [Macrosiphum euphorbiae]
MRSSDGGGDNDSSGGDNDSSGGDNDSSCGGGWGSDSREMWYLACQYGTRITRYHKSTTATITGHSSCLGVCSLSIRYTYYCTQ